MRLLSTKLTKDNSASAGSTIIEVMLALSIIGAVLAGAYATANRSIQIVRQSHERVEAMKVAENQLESIRSFVVEASQSDDNDDQGVFIEEPFCINANGDIVIPENYELTDFNELEHDVNLADEMPEECLIPERYYSHIVYDEDSQRFMVTIRWHRLTGSIDQVRMGYGTNQPGEISFSGGDLPEPGDGSDPGPSGSVSCTSLTASPNPVDAGSGTTITAQYQTVDASINSVTFSLGDGSFDRHLISPSPSAAQINHTYNSSGDYGVEATIRADDDSTGELITDTCPARTVFVTGDDSSDGAPGQVTNLIASRARFITSISLSWSSVSGATSYEIQYRTSSVANWSDLASTSSSSYTHATGQQCQYFEYRVRARNSNGTGDWSNTANATTDGFNCDTLR